MPIRLSTSMSDIGCGCRKVLTDADSALDPHGRRRPWQLGPAKHACEAQEQRARTPAVSPFICLLNMRDGQVNWVLGPETHNGADKKTGMRAMTRTNSGTGPFAAAGPTIPVVRAGRRIAGCRRSVALAAATASRSRSTADAPRSTLDRCGPGPRERKASFCRQALMAPRSTRMKTTKLLKTCGRWIGREVC